MKLGFRFKLFALSVAVIVVSFFGADIYLASALEARLTRSVNEEGLSRLSLVERDVSLTAAALDDFAAWDAVADDLGARAKQRVTIVRRDGKVLGDSEVALQALATLESHAERPEVREALARGQGSSMRVSDTVHKRLAYVAVPFSHGGETAGVVRLATPLDDVDSAVAGLHRTLVFASLAACGVAIVMSSIAAHWIARMLRALTAAARRMARGNLDVRTRIPGSDEVAELSAALDQLAGGLSLAMTELRAERDLQSGILDGMQEGVLVLDRGENILRMNPSLRTMLLLGSDAIGRPLLDVVRHAELKELVDAGHVQPSSGEIEISGLKPRRLLVRAATLRGQDGAEDGALLVVFRDVTDMRRLETMRRDFVANVSHELRTPVTSVRSAAETLREGALADPEAAKKFTDIIARNAERLQRLIEDLLDLSRIESRELHLHPEAVDLRSFVAHGLGLFRERAEQNGVRLRADVPQAAGSPYADKRALEQVFTNLVDNAVKYSPRATVKVWAEARDGRVALIVGDTGPGIPPKHLPRIFERFYRVDDGRSRELGGTGLGLSIVKHLVEAMGGTIDVASTVGAGTTFTVTLPLPPRVSENVTAI